ncbi:GntR family transcriptional regulator, partial [Mycobacterium sp. ACS1612]|uniref:GntR family transcriptional regulator n=1 Tax=Mycobacterium sp. ACS1612 TaxID=1834117 RepID=UPI000B0DFDEC
MATSVYEEFRDAILTGRFAAGQVLSENALATEFGKSRTPVREALHRLEIEGLVERVPRGVRVRASSPEEILDIYEVRITLEGAAAKAAPERATEFDRMQLRSAQQAMVDVDDGARGKAAGNRRVHDAA